MESSSFRDPQFSIPLDVDVASQSHLYAEDAVIHASVYSLPGTGQSSSPRFHSRVQIAYHCFPERLHATALLACQLAGLSDRLAPLLEEGNVIVTLYALAIRRRCEGKDGEELHHLNRFLILELAVQDQEPTHPLWLVDNAHKLAEHLLILLGIGNAVAPLSDMRQLDIALRQQRKTFSDHIAYYCMDAEGAERWFVPERTGVSPFEGDFLFRHLAQLAPQQNRRASIGYSFTFGRQSWYQREFFVSGASIDLLKSTDGFEVHPDDSKHALASNRSFSEPAISPYGAAIHLFGMLKIGMDTNDDDTDKDSQ